MPKEYVVITGASSGIGREAARRFADRGFSVVLTARRKNRLEELGRVLRRGNPAVDAVVHPADLSRSGAPADLYQEVRRLPLHAWINCAGRGYYGSVPAQTAEEIQRLLQLDVQAVAALSAMFARDFRDRPGAQLINVSSCGGYINVPQAVTYCAAKFFVSAFTEGLAAELSSQGAALRAKVFAPAATATEFGRTANNVEHYDYGRAFPRYHTAAQAADLLLQLYDSDAVVGLVDREDFTFQLSGPRLASAQNAAGNQRLP